jgi:hypothetical protein
VARTLHLRLTRRFDTSDRRTGVRGANVSPTAGAVNPRGWPIVAQSLTRVAPASLTTRTHWCILGLPLPGGIGRVAAVLTGVMARGDRRASSAWWRSLILFNDGRPLVGTEEIRVTCLKGVSPVS